MAESILFNQRQRSWIGESLEVAEALAENYFQVDLEDSKRFSYDLQTLIHLKGPEKTQRALAQVCKYEYYKRNMPFGGNEFYRICLQDDKILSTTRTDSSSLLRPLLLYVITHELIHVIRFSLDSKKFFLSLQEKKAEEKDVHRMTYELLKSLKDPRIEILLECYRPWWERSNAFRSMSALDNI